MTIAISAFAWVPPPIQGLVRDLRVRWALEEAGLDYAADLLRLGENKAEPYRHWQPFGQVPAYREDGLSLFESGAIVLHVGERCEALLPRDERQRARAKTWIFAAINSIEPPIMLMNWLGFQQTAEARAIEAQAAPWAQSRLDELAAWLGERDYLEEVFTAGDLMMATVLRILRSNDRIRLAPNVERYSARCEARPAFQRALDTQMAAYESHAPR